MLIYAIRDKVAETFALPFFQPTDQVALRLFKLEVNRPQADNLLYHNPRDFELYSLGELNNETGEISPHKKLIATAEALRAEKEEQK